MKQIVFTKYSAERSREFAIRTDIIKENTDVLAVEKRALYPEGQTHIKKLCHWYQLLQQEYQAEQFEVNRCQETAQGVRLEYLTGETLQERMEKLNEQGQEAELEVYIEEYLKRMTQGHKWKKFQQTEEFCRVFGEVSLSEKLQCQEVTNIDMIFSNILLEGETWHFIDYEWTFSFPIPIHFVLYRAFLMAASEMPGVKALDLTKMLQRLGIGIEEQQAYQKMEAHFQEYVRGGEKPLRDMIREMGYKAIPMTEVETLCTGQGLKQVIVNYKTAEGWKEQGQTLELANTGSDVARIHLPLTEEIQELELKIAQGSCLLWIKELRIENSVGKTEKISPQGLGVNGMDLGSGLYIVLAESTGIRIPCNQIKSMEIILQIQNLQMDINQIFVQQLNELNGTKLMLEQENLRLTKRYKIAEWSIFFRLYHMMREIAKRCLRR